MVLLFNDVLNAAEIADLRKALDDAARETDSNKSVSSVPSAILTDALLSHPLFVLGVQPKMFSQPQFSCRGPKSTDQSQNEQAVVLGDDTIRLDVAVTAFLSDPEGYDGGELIIDSGYGGQTYKERAGCCIAYPMSARSSIAAITRGQRWGVDLFVQSLIRQQERREILYNVSCAERYLEIFGKGTNDNLARLHRCRQMLSRIWTEQ